MPAKFKINDHIKVALAAGFCIVLTAVVFKKMLNIEISHLESSIPGLIFFVYEIPKKKWPDNFWTRPLFWSLLMLTATAIIILREVW